MSIHFFCFLLANSYPPPATSISRRRHAARRRKASSQQSLARPSTLDARPDSYRHKKLNIYTLLITSYQLPATSMSRRSRAARRRIPHLALLKIIFSININYLLNNHFSRFGFFVKARATFRQHRAALSANHSNSPNHSPFYRSHSC